MLPTATTRHDNDGLDARVMPAARTTIGVHGVLFMAGLAVIFGVDGGPGYAVDVVWAGALASTALLGLAGAVVSGTRAQATGVLVGTVVASLVEIIVSIAIALIWLHFNPDFELS